MAAGRHVGFCFSSKMTSRHAVDCPWVTAYQIWWRYLKNGWNMAIFLFSRWRPAAILDFDKGQKWRNGTFRTVHVYHLAKFGDNISIGCWVIAFCGKIQNGGVRHFEFAFGYSGPPTKLAYGPEVAQKIRCQSNFYFSRYRDFKILKIWLVPHASVVAAGYVQSGTLSSFRASGPSSVQSTFRTCFLICLATLSCCQFLRVYIIHSVSASGDWMPRGLITKKS